MRDNALIRAEQAKASITPLVPVDFWNGSDWVSVFDRVEDLRYNLEPYGCLATIELNNHDGALSAFNWRKRQIRVALGMMIDEVQQYSWIPYLWCYAFKNRSVGQSDDYPQGANLVTLYCEGAMNWLARWLVDDVEGYRFNDPDDTVDGRNDMTIRQMLY